MEATAATVPMLREVRCMSKAMQSFRVPNSTGTSRLRAAAESEVSRERIEKTSIAA
jgi:hypothetical protein